MFQPHRLCGNQAIEGQENIGPTSHNIYNIGPTYHNIYNLGPTSHNIYNIILVLYYNLPLSDNYSSFYIVRNITVINVTAEWNPMLHPL